MGAAGRRVTFRPGARVGTIAASLAAAASLLLPNTVLAATVIGSAQGTFLCSNPGDFVQASWSGATYAVPSDGTSITSWSVLAGADVGPVALLVWRPTADPAVFILVSLSPSVTLTQNTLNNIPLAEAIPVQPGDLLGLRVEGPVECAQETFLATDTAGSTFGNFAALNVPTQLFMFSGFQLNIAATVELASPPPPPPTPTTADQCKHGGWQGLTDSNGTLFKNQGDCVSFVATQGTNLAAGQTP
jgi:hypothetical protein